MGTIMKYRIDLDTYSITPNRMKSEDGTVTVFPMKIISQNILEQIHIVFPMLEKVYKQLLRNEDSVFTLFEVKIKESAVELHYRNSVSGDTDKIWIDALGSLDLELALEVGRGEGKEPDRYWIDVVKSDLPRIKEQHENFNRTITLWDYCNCDCTLGGTNRRRLASVEEEVFCA